MVISILNNQNNETLCKNTKDGSKIEEPHPGIKPRTLSIEMTKAVFTEENWQLYKLYANEVHEKGKDDNDKEDYKEWLCSQKLNYETQKDSESG